MSDIKKSWSKAGYNQEEAHFYSVNQKQILDFRKRQENSEGKTLDASEKEGKVYLLPSASHINSKKEAA